MPERNSPFSGPTSTWVHAWAVFTVLATLPLLVLGAEVTTKGVGMADPEGWRFPWEMLQTWAEANLGLRIEHGHRLAGMIVGLSVIVLNALLWFREPRLWVRGVGVLALVLVIAQGLLGKYRVDLNALVGRDLALVHGLFAQVVIATLFSLVLFTSRRWCADRAETPVSPKLRRTTAVLAVVVYGQLILGGVVRHTDWLIGPRGHLMGAFLVLGIATLAIIRMLEAEHRERFGFWAKLLMVLLTVQIVLGMEAWLARFFVPSADLPQLRSMPGVADWFRSVHYVVGTLVFATTVMVTLVAQRRTIAEPILEPVRRLEGVA